MGRVFGDLDEYFDDGLVLPIAGVEYSIQSASAELGLWCQLVDQRSATVEDAAGAAEELPPPPGVDKDTLFEVVLLGQECVDQMVANGVSFEKLRFCATTAFIRTIRGDEAARLYWESGGDPNRVRPTGNRAERRAAEKKATPRKASGSRTTSTAAAATTRRRASGSGTSSRTKSTAPAKATKSAGRRSSAIGAS